MPLPLALAALVLILAACGGTPDVRPADPPRQPGQQTTPPIDAPAVAVQPLPHAESPLPGDPAVRWGTLPSGARYAIMPSTQPPGRISLRLRIASGSLLEDDDQRGLAHLLEHLAFCGSVHHPPGTLIPSLQRLGIGFGNHLNAHTGFDETVYKLDLPDTAAATLEMGLTVLADQAGGLLLDAAEVERERGVVLAELRDGDGPGMRLRKRELEVLTAGTRIAERLPIGLAETVTAATPDLLRRYYETWYRPERMLLTVVGDLDPAAVEPAVRRVLGGARALAPAIPEPALGQLEPGTAAVALHDPEAGATSVRLVGLFKHPLQPDQPTLRREQLLRDLGEAVLARRLRRLVEADAEAPLLSGGGFSYPWLGMYLAGASASTRPGRALDTLRLLVAEFRRLVEHGPTPAELDIELAALRSQLDQAVSQAASRRNEALAAALYQSVAGRRVFQSPQQERELYLGLAAAATPATVREALARGWDSRTRTVAVVTGKDDLGPDGDRLVAEVLTAALAEPVAPPTATAAASWAYGIEQTYDGPLPAVGPDGWAVGTAAGISLAAKRTGFQPGRVALRVRLPLRTGPRQAGLAELAGRALADGGLGQHTAGELAEVLAGSTARFGGLTIEDGALVWSAACAPADLRRAAELLRAWIEDAAWRPEAEARAKATWLTALDAEANEVEAATWRRVQELQLPDDAWRRAADRAAAEAATLAQVRAWLTPLLAEAPLSVAVVGDIEVEPALRTLAAVFGAPRAAVPVTATPADARAALPAQPAPAAGEHRLSVPSSVAKAQVVVVWPTDDIYDIGRSRRLGLLGGVFRERLREVVRERFGDAYSPAAWHAAGDEWRGQGALTAVIGCAVDRVDAVRDATLAIAAELTTGLDPGLLDRVRLPLLNAVAEQRRQDGWWLGLLARAAEQPFRLEWQASLETDLRAATAAEVAGLAATYLRPETALIVIGTSQAGSVDAPLP